MGETLALFSIFHQEYRGGLYSLVLSTAMDNKGRVLEKKLENISCKGDRREGKRGGSEKDVTQHCETGSHKRVRERGKVVACKI